MASKKKSLSDDQGKPESPEEVAQKVARREARLSELIRVNAPKVIMNDHIRILFEAKEVLKKLGGEHLLEKARMAFGLNAFSEYVLDRTALGKLKETVCAALYATNQPGIPTPTKPFDDKQLDEDWQKLTARIRKNDTKTWEALYALVTSVYVDMNNRMVKQALRKK